MRFLYRTQQGQTLLELVMAIGVVAIIITGLVVAVTQALHNSQSSRLRSIAVQYAVEGVEHTRQLRDTTTWDTFLTYADVVPKQWCLDASGNWTAYDGSAPCPTLQNKFSRTVTFTWGDPIVDVVVTVTWQENGQQFTSTLETHFTQWR